MFLEIKYKNNIVSGQFLTPLQTSVQPNVSLSGLDTNKKYILIMYDPNSIFGNHIHWIVSNIKGNDFSSGKSIFVYGGPTPPKGSGIHNYTFSLYKMTEEPHISINSNNRNILLHKLLEKLNIKGNPIITVKFTSKFQSKGKGRRTKRRTKRITRRRTKRKN